MLTWLTSNISTVIISIVLAAIVIGIVCVLINDKRKGKSSCGGNCGCCPMGGSCNHKQN